MECKRRQSIIPEKYNPSLPVIFATEPSGARSPLKIWMCPVSLIGFDTGLIITCKSKSEKCIILEEAGRRF